MQVKQLVTTAKKILLTIANNTIVKDRLKRKGRQMIDILLYITNSKFDK